MSVTKKVFLEPVWRLRGSMRYLVDAPPEGYEFISTRPADVRLAWFLSRWRFPWVLLSAAGKVSPYVLLNSGLQRWRPPPAGTALTYALGHVVFRPEPWVVEVESSYALFAGFSLGHQKRRWMRGIVERALASPHCRGIRCWSEAGRRTLTSWLDCERFAGKITVIPMAVPPRQRVERGGRDKVRLLFVGSFNFQGHKRAFEVCGGHEAMETFARLRQRYTNLEMVVRSEVPDAVKSRYGALEGCRLIEGLLPYERMEQEYLAADIFLMPSAASSVFKILDAMAHGLPIVGLNMAATAEYIEDGKTGLLAQPSRQGPYYYGPAGFAEGLRLPLPAPDEAVVEQLVRHMSLLIERPELRMAMGEAGRQAVESGTFSIARHNERLNAFFDAALEGSAVPPQ